MAEDIFWNKESTMKLIGLYEMHPNLYNSADYNYINRIKRADSLKAISEGLKHLVPHITVDAIRRKLHTLRNQFIREFRLVENSKKIGAGLEGIYEPKLWCYDQLLFLKTHCSTRSYASNVEENSSSSTSVFINCLSEENCIPKRKVHKFEKQQAKMREEIFWNKESTVKLISLYEMHPNLYNSADCNYINRIQRANSLNAISDGLKHLVPQITINAIRRKLHTLRNQFIREFRLVENSKKIGVSPEDIYEPKLWCYDLLFFLKNYCSTRSCVSNIEENSNFSTSVFIDCLSKEERIPKRKTKTPTSAVSKGLEKIAVLLEKKINNKSSYSWLGEQVIFEMDNIKDERVKRKASYAIQKILQESFEEDLALRNGCSPSSTARNTPSTSRHNEYEEIVIKKEEYLYNT